MMFKSVGCARYRTKAILIRIQIHFPLHYAHLVVLVLTDIGEFTFLNVSADGLNGLLEYYASIMMLNYKAAPGELHYQSAT